MNTIPSMNGAAGRILIADDEPSVRDSVGYALAQEGFEVTAAEDGTDAEERGLPDADEEAIIAAMVANPAYVNRPFVETDKGVRFCRPQDVVREIL